MIKTQCQTCGEAAHIDECDHCSLIASAWATDLNKLSKAEADNAALRKVIDVCRETILSVKLTSTKHSEKWEWCDETLNLIEQTLSKGKTE